jgi:hypothetical protein
MNLERKAYWVVFTSVYGKGCNKYMAFHQGHAINCHISYYPNTEVTEVWDIEPTHLKG